MDEDDEPVQEFFGLFQSLDWDCDESSEKRLEVGIENMMMWRMVMTGRLIHGRWMKDDCFQ